MILFYLNFSEGIDLDINDIIKCNRPYIKTYEKI